jgi:hypothetical protein
VNPHDVEGYISSSLLDTSMYEPACPQISDATQPLCARRRTSARLRRFFAGLAAHRHQHFSAQPCAALPGFIALSPCFSGVLLVGEWFAAILCWKHRRGLRGFQLDPLLQGPGSSSRWRGAAFRCGCWVHSAGYSNDAVCEGRAEVYSCSSTCAPLSRSAFSPIAVSS